MRGQLQVSSPLVQDVYWQTYEQDQIKRHFSPHSPGGDLADRHAFLPCSKLAYEQRRKGMTAKEGRYLNAIMSYYRAFMTRGLELVKRCFNPEKIQQALGIM